MKTILVTGGAGFIGSAVVRRLVREGHSVVNVDKLTYAGNVNAVAEAAQNPLYHFEQADICDGKALQRIFEHHRPQGVMHLAAESHVDRSIDSPADFVETNLVGTYTLLEVARRYWEALPQNRKSAFRLLHVSTDEVYGSLGAEGKFGEDSPYRPNSPYSASKAGSDHLARAWHHTFGLPVIITNCSNNYGPWQYPEKLIPVTIYNALAGGALPVYGDGRNVREWIYVEDHVDGLLKALRLGLPGEVYNLGSEAEVSNLNLVQQICSILDTLHPNPRHKPYASQIAFVKDRPGHDFRYAIDSGKAQRELGYKAATPLSKGLTQTVQWFLDHPEHASDDAAKRRGLA
ncbi:MAG: dTDP-glucose 4,6-dehydratase [Deltaproteobacteria bacterium]|nr:dTDP-glucose 4,6-dehydratase [Deltaproteobacteria bacterium]